MKAPKVFRKRVRALTRWARGKGVYYFRDIRRPIEWHGSANNGWAILPGTVDDNSIVYSFGVGDNISFDLSLIEKYGVQIYAFDPTLQTAEWLRAEVVPAKFSYNPLALADRDGEIEFFAPVAGRKCHSSIEREPGQAPSYRVPARRLKTIMQQLGHRRVDVLKIDIEGAEYDVLTDMLESGIAVGQLLVEFHHRFPTIGIGKTKQAIRALREHRFRIFWISPDHKEFCFIHADSLEPPPGG